jgi:PKD domain/Galactose oxidase, central domain
MRSYFLGGLARCGPKIVPTFAVLLLGLLLVGAFPIGGAPAGSTGAATSARSISVASTTVAPTNASNEGWYHLPVHGASPLPRDDGSMVYDAKDGYVLLFGGCSKPLCPLLDTWKYQGGTWTNLTGSVGIVPTARYGAAIAYDARDGYVVLFGGISANGVLGDTWTFEYGRWTEVATSASPAPSPRYDAGLIYDTASSEVILFGGDSPTGAPLSDTWGFAGGVWTNLSSAAGPAPPARFSAGFAYDTADQMGILFGGTGLCGAYCSDTWSFAAGRWTNLTTAVGPNVPSARSEASLAFDNGRGEVVLAGGTDGSILSDTWGFAHGAWMYLSVNTTTSPGARTSISLAYDPSDGYLLAYGGQAATGLKTGTWAFLTPLSVGVVPALPTVLTGEADHFSAVVSGGYGPVNVTWNFGDGSAVVLGTSSGHTFFAAGTYPVIATGTDQLGVTASAAATISVEIPPLVVAISASPAAPAVGQTVTWLAAASGGMPPYSYQWSGDVAGCSGLTAPTLTCPASSSGPLAVSVTVVDLGRGSVVGTGSVIVGGGPSGLAGHGTTASFGPATTGLSTTFTSVYLTLAIFVACAVGVVTYRAGRRREAARNAIRPHCYAVPAWSETPADFPEPSSSTTEGEGDGREFRS